MAVFIRGRKPDFIVVAVVPWNRATSAPCVLETYSRS